MKRKMDSNPRFASKTIAMHNFVEIKEGRASTKKDYVLYFGRYSEEKGIKTLLQVCKELPDIPFIFAGSGPLKAQMADLPNVKMCIRDRLYSPCVATIGTIKKETNSWKFTLGMVLFQLAVAWVGAVLVYQIGSLFV